MFRWPVALEPIVQGSDGRLGAFDELAERVAVEDQHAGDAVAPVVGGRFAADLIDFGGAASRELADVEQGEDGLVVAVGLACPSVCRRPRIIAEGAWGRPTLARSRSALRSAGQARPSTHGRRRLACLR